VDRVVFFSLHWFPVLLGAAYLRNLDKGCPFQWGWWQFLLPGKPVILQPPHTAAHGFRGLCLELELVTQ
jgi:hypothetical protein